MTAAPLRLLHVLSTFDVGGPQVRFAQLANALGPKFRHVVIAMDGGYAAARLLTDQANAECVRIDVDKTRHLGNLARYRATIARYLPDRLVTYNWGAVEWGLANMLRGTPHVHVEDGFGPEERDRQIRRRVLFRRLVLSGAERLVVPSRTLERLARQVWRIPARKIVYVPNGIDVTRFDAGADPALRARYFTTPDGLPTIITVAALRPEKNIGRLVDAFAQVRARTPCRLVVVGDGGEREALEVQAAAQGVAADVVFTGHLTGPERILPVADVFALSSDTEQMPYSVLEAMAARLPVAAVNVGDVAEMLSPANREMVCPRDAPALAQVLERLLTDAALRQRLGEANRARVERQYGEPTMVAAYETIFSGSIPSPTP